MNFYDNGSIIVIKNLVFKDGVIDHAYRSGRPCLVISNNDDEITFLTLSSKHNDSIYEHDYLFDNCRKFHFKDNTYVNLEHIYKRKACFYKEVNKLNEKEYHLVLKKFIEVNLENPTEEFLEILDEISYQLPKNKNLVKSYK